MYIFLLVLGGGQDKPAWTACPPGVKITRVGGKISRDSGTHVIMSVAKNVAEMSSYSQLLSLEFPTK